MLIELIHLKINNSLLRTKYKRLLVHKNVIIELHPEKALDQVAAWVYYQRVNYHND